jgi:16S rRNA (cytosine967-C5)-methyltransferase
MTLDARACAARVLVRVITDGRSLSDVLPAAVQTLADPRQRALVQELSYGTLRWYYRLDALLQRLLQKPLKQRDADVRCVLLTGAGDPRPEQAMGERAGKCRITQLPASGG